MRRRKFKGGLSVLLSVMLALSTLPASAEGLSALGGAVTEETVQGAENSWQRADSDSGNGGVSGNGMEAGVGTGQKPVEQEIKTRTVEQTAEAADSGEVWFNTGNHVWKVAEATVTGGEVADAYFEQDGSYTINIPEENPFFPYEVQFTCNGDVTTEWFMDPEDSVEIGGHTFYVSASFDNTEVTQMSLKVAGKVFPVYPAEKTFVNDGEGVSLLSLLPLEERRFTVDLMEYTSIELTMLSVNSVYMGEKDVTDTVKLVNGDYTVNEPGDILNNWFRYYGLIIGDGDQLGTENIRCIIEVKVRDFNVYGCKWILPSFYRQDSAGRRQKVEPLVDWYQVVPLGGHLLVYGDLGGMVDGTQLYMGLRFNPDIFGSEDLKNFRAYKGRFSDPKEAVAAEDITEALFESDMLQENGGYPLNIFTPEGTHVWVTLVTSDAEGNATGCFPFNLFFETTRYPVKMYLHHTEEMFAPGVGAFVDSGGYYRQLDGYIEYTINCNEHYPIDDLYDLRMFLSSEMTAVYVGFYASIAEATASGAENIKDAVLGRGYRADYSQGVQFTIFSGEDGTENRRVDRYFVKLRESFGNSAGVRFVGLKKSDGTNVDTYIVETEADSYGVFNYPTMLVGEDVDLASLAPEFKIPSDNYVCTAGSSTPEESGKSLHDFSKGAVCYTLMRNYDGKLLGNTYLQVVKPIEGKGQLYINSLADPGAGTRVEDGIIYSTREVPLDSYNKNVHDILLINMGTESIPALGVELVSDVVELDEYWTLQGKYDLSGFAGVEKQTQYGELPNLAKIRIKAKTGIESGTEVSGTMTIKSGDTVLMVLTLTGLVSDPIVTADKITTAVKYVPYSVDLQNRDYSWRRVRYALAEESRLPEGMELKPQGEIYGVPMETGEFEFTVNMECWSATWNGSPSEVSRTYVLTVLENTDENVAGVTDSGYGITEPIQNIYLSSMEEGGSQTLVSEGKYDEFAAIYLDGERLVEGEDYTSETTGTKLTVLNQTLVRGNVGTHTLGIEFRTGDEDILKRAAQNYVVAEKEEESGDDNTGDSGSGDDNTGDNGSGDDDTGDSSSGDDNTGNGGSDDDNTGNGGSGDDNTGNGGSNDDNTGNDGSGDNDTGNGGTGDNNNENNNTGDGNPGNSTEENGIFSDDNNGFGGSIILTENGMYEVTGLSWENVNRGLMEAAVQETSDPVVGRNVDVVTGGQFEVPAYVLDNIVGRDVTLALHVGRGLALSITGSDVVEVNRAFSVRIVPSVVPEDVNRQLMGSVVEHRAFNLEWGEDIPFHVNVHIGFGAENAGRTAVLYRFDRDTGRVTVAGTFQVNEEGQAMFGLSREGEYTAVVLEEFKGIVSYTVVAGDTFRRIASKHGMTMEQMKAVNPEIKNINKIRVGQKLYVCP